jgi:prepilin-type N-terminal cleavage/methylation domain-containing protein
MLMKTIRHLTAHRDERGFTLIELLVAAVVFVIAIGALLGILRKNEGAREMSYYVLESRQNARAGLDFIIGDLRMAGSGIPTKVVTSTAAGDSLILFGVAPDTTGGATDRMRILGAMSGVETELRSSMPSASAEFNVQSCEGFGIGDLAVVTFGSWANLFQITQVQGPALKLQHNPASPFNLPGGHNPFPPGGYPAGSKIYKVDLITYFVDRSDTTCPLLMRQDGTQQPKVVSEYITHLEFGYVLVDQSVVAVPPDPTLVRRVIVTIEAASSEKSQKHVTRLVSSGKPRAL